MKLTVKTLKGEKFPIEVEASATVEQVKTVIEATKAELPAAALKLIHSGKVLKDTDSLDSCGVKENDFLVVMVTKPKKTAAAPAPAAAAAPAPVVETPAVPAAEVAAPVATPTTPAAAAPAAAATAADTPAPARAATATAASEFPAEIVANLVALGFPEEEVRHCLVASRGNPDIAVEFLTTGIPPSFSAPASSSSSSSSTQPLQALRNHPQFNDLRRLVQSNPAMLQQVLTQIGQQQPDLLHEINANQAAFLELMNSPIIDSDNDTTMQDVNRSASSTNSSSNLAAAAAAADPTQMAQMMQNMDPAQLQMMATMMGLTPEQVQAVGRMIGQLPPEQLQEYMAQAMGGGEGIMGGGVADSFGGLQAHQQQHVLRLNPEEMAAVDRLTEMGFDRAEAAQAFLACDKNEALAANLLMDGGFLEGLPDDSNDDGGGEDDDDMYS